MRWFLLVLILAVPRFAAWGDTEKEVGSPGAKQLRYELHRAEDSKQLKPRAGEDCIVCGSEIDQQSGMVLPLRGRRVPVGKAKLSELKRNPEKYFSSLQPKGALFTESAVRPKAQIGWLVFGILSLGLVCFRGFVAARRIRQSCDSSIEIPEGLTKIPSTAQPALCVACGAEAHPSASRCSSCGAELKPRYQSESKLLGGRSGK